MGDYVITWNERVNGNYDVKMRGYNADGTSKFDEVVVNPNTANRQAKSVVASVGLFWRGLCYWHSQYAQHSALLSALPIRKAVFLFG